MRRPRDLGPRNPAWQWHTGAMRTSALGGTAAAIALAMAATSGTATAAAPTDRAAGPSPSSTSVDASSHAQRVHSGMTLEEKIGQMFMVATPADGLSSQLRDLVLDRRVGNVILTGRSTSGVDHTRRVTTNIQALTEHSWSTHRVPAFIAADQEGGKVQVLQGDGYSTIPTALEQGTWSDATLRRRSARWGVQLSRSGVNQNLAPVLDVVTEDMKPVNDPIGQHDREFGSTPSKVSAKGNAYRRGMERAGVAATVKHFPTLGHVRGNTDTTSGVTDRHTTKSTDALEPFQDAVDQDAPFVMVSSAEYAEIDPGVPGVFSREIVTGMLREDMGFDGLVISDDLGAAEQVAGWSPGTRATRFIRAGGDMVLTVQLDTVGQMLDAVESRARSDPAFMAKVQESSLRVLDAKDEAGMLGTRMTPSGNWSPWTVKRIQEWLGKEQTGTFDRDTISSLQWRIGARTTGDWNAGSFRALQGYLGMSHDGTQHWNERTTQRFQRYLNTQL